MDVDRNRIRQNLEAINAFNASPGAGITRFTFSEEYEQARAYVVDEMLKIGAQPTITLGGNLRCRLAGTGDEPAVMAGSHLDTVLHGGRYDGVAGVVASMEAARVIREKGIVHRHPIDVVVFAEEEGARFGSVMTGSRAWIGQIGQEELKRVVDDRGISYLDAMARAGLAPDDDSILRPEQVKAMFELHIEQSVVLERKGLQIGVVEAIAGIRQLLVTISGVSNHAGATPMDLRHDALQGAAEVISAIEAIATRPSGGSTVATVGWIACEPGQANVIPGRAQFTVDIRDRDARVLEATVQEVVNVISETCQRRGLTYEILTRSDTPPVTLSKEMVRVLQSAAVARGLEPLVMPSGALHDSSILAEMTDVGMIFVPSVDGRSHCPQEYSRLEDIEAGANVLLDALIETAS